MKKIQLIKEHNIMVPTLNGRSTNDPQVKKPLLSQKY